MGVSNVLNVYELMIFFRAVLFSFKHRCSVHKLS